jgi:hypothetical protein
MPGTEPRTDDAHGDAALADMVRAVVAANPYMVLGTADASGRPWTSPVFFAADDCRELYWMSSPDVTHSRNIAVRPDISIVVFDSRAVVGTGDESAAYMTARAAVVAPADLEEVLAGAPSFARHGARAVGPDDLRAPGPYRLYRATVTEHSVVCPRRAGEPCTRHGLRHDHRTPVVLAP